MSYRTEHFTVSKPAVKSGKGLVAAQHHEAAEVGAAVLRDGGNATDAAVATALALATVEPWMSGLGGGGFMLGWDAEAGRAWGVDFGMISPAGLDPARYPLADGGGGEAGSFIGFAWPPVVEDRNVRGPEAVCVPGSVAGLALALEHFGSMDWKTVMAPAIETAERGLPVDWYATLQIAYGMSGGLAEQDEARRTYFPEGCVPTSTTTYDPRRIVLGRLPATMRRLAEAGPRDFYEGELAAALVEDLRAGGSAITTEDLARYEARVVDPVAIPYRDAHVHLVPGYNGSPTFARALRTLSSTLEPGAGLGPDAYLAWASALEEAYRFRFEKLGHDGDQSLLACTTHLSVVDAKGNMVSLTNTLLERFGSRWVSPATGILMNNGMTWFDPRPGRPNSIAAGVRPLSNMCPVLATRDGRGWFATGASGGRRIVPAGFQLTSLLIDFAMSLDEAYATPRIDVSGEPEILVDVRLAPEIKQALGARFPIRESEQSVGPKTFANPQTVLRDGDVNWAAAVPHLATAAVAAQ